MKTIFSLIALFSFTAILAQDVVEAELTPKDPEAKKMLDQLASKHRSYESLQFDFTFNLKNSDGVDETKTGTVLLKGDKYRLNLGAVVIVCDAQTVWMANPATEEVQINNVSTEDDGAFITPNQLLDTYEEEFKYRLEGEGQASGKKVSFIRLYPMEPENRPFHTLEIAVDAANSELVEMKIFYRDGNIYTYTLNNMKSNIPATDGQFQYDVPVDWDLIDMREG